MYAQITGITDMRAILAKYGSQETYDGFQKEVVEETAKLMRKLASRYKGDLEKSIRVQKVGMSKYRIILDVPYGKFTEWGTRFIDIGTIENPKAVVSMSGKQSYRPYMRVAVWRMLNQHADAIKKTYFRK